MDNKGILKALKWMIQNDDTNVYNGSLNEDGTINQFDGNAHWLNGVAQAQVAYYEATGKVVKNANSFVAPELEFKAKSSKSKSKK